MIVSLFLLYYYNLTVPVLRAEWLKSRARAARWTEEVQLLREEMRHVLAFLEWRSNWWKERPALRQVDTALAEALRAFASEQAQLQLDIAASFRDLWRKPLQDSDTPNANQSAASMNDVTDHFEDEDDWSDNEDEDKGLEDDDDDDEY
jgi:hypothetical protein